MNRIRQMIGLASDKPKEPKNFMTIDGQSLNFELPGNITVSHECTGKSLREELISAIDELEMDESAKSGYRGEVLGEYNVIDIIKRNREAIIIPKENFAEEIPQAETVRDAFTSEHLKEMYPPVGTLISVKVPGYETNLKFHTISDYSLRAQIFYNLKELTAGDSSMFDDVKSAVESITNERFNKQNKQPIAKDYIQDATDLILENDENRLAITKELVKSSKLQKRK